jgi:hypothetical protein
VSVSLKTSCIAWDTQGFKPSEAAKSPTPVLPGAAQVLERLY